MRYRRRPPFWLLVAFVPLGAVLYWLITAGADAYLDDPNMVILAPLGAAFTLVLGFWVYGILEGVRRTREWRALAEWGAPRGLQLDLGGLYGASTLGDRDDAAVENVVGGYVVGAREGSVAHVAIPRRRWRFLAAIPLMAVFAYGSFDLWTVCRLRLAPGEVGPFRRLHLRRSGLRDASLVAAFSDAATSLRHVELESVELHDLYGLEVHDAADDIAVRRLFEPSFIQWLIERAGRPITVDIHGEELVVAVPGRHLHRDELDDVVETARTVAERVAPVIRDEVPPVTGPVEAIVPRTPWIMYVISAAALFGTFGFVGYMTTQGTEALKRPAADRAKARELAASATIPTDTVLTYRATLAGFGGTTGAGILDVATSSRRRLVRLQLSTETRWQRWLGDEIEWSCSAPAREKPVCRRGEDAGLGAVVAMLTPEGIAERFTLDGFATTSTSGAATCASLLGGVFCVRPDGVVSELRSTGSGGVLTLDLDGARPLEEGDLSAPAKVRG